MNGSPTPPRLATRLLRLVTSDDDFEAIGGDLEELYRLDISTRMSPASARLWYWRQVMSVTASRIARAAPS